MSKSKAKFALGDRVVVIATERAGTIVARTEFLEGEAMLQVEHDSVVERQPIKASYAESALMVEDLASVGGAGQGTQHAAAGAAA